MRHYHRSHIGALTIAAALAAGSLGVGAMHAASRSRAAGSRPNWKHDPERLAAAEAKRARKNAKRLRDARVY
jgi:hypothetical protein